MSSNVGVQEQGFSKKKKKKQKPKASARDDLWSLSQKAFPFLSASRVPAEPHRVSGDVE